MNSQNTSSVIDANDRFGSKEFKYTVQINIEINAGFLWAIAKCLWQRKDLRITHTYTSSQILPPKLNNKENDK